MFYSMIFKEYLSEAAYMVWWQSSFDCFEMKTDDCWRCWRQLLLFYRRTADLRQSVSRTVLLRERQQVIDVCLPEPNLTLAPHRSHRPHRAVVSLRCYCWPGCGLVWDRFCGRKSTSLRQFPEPNRGGVISGGGLSQRRAPSCFYHLFKVACSSSLRLWYDFMFSAVGPSNFLWAN